MSPCFPGHPFRLVEPVIHFKFVGACPGIRAWYVSSASVEIQGSGGRISVDWTAMRGLSLSLAGTWRGASAVCEWPDFVM